VKTLKAFLVMLLLGVIFAAGIGWLAIEIIHIYY